VIREYFIKASLLITGFIHLLPVLGVLGSDKLFKLYGVQLHDQNVILLLRHRAILFFILGSLFIFSVFKMELRFISYIMAFLSMGSFIMLYLSGVDINIFQKRVFIIDLITMILLFAGAYLDGFGFQRFLNCIKS
jgi:hypothetical protein